MPDDAVPRGREMDDPLATEADTLRRNARMFPHHTATIYGTRRLTYAELDALASRVANGLLAAVEGRQRRVAFLARNSDLFFEALFGIAKAGHVSLPINWRLSPAEIAYVLRDAGARFLFVDPDFEPALAELKGLGVELDHVMVFGRSRAGNADYSAWRDANPAHDPLVPVGPEDSFIQIYTSGTTGHPKGADIAHRASMMMRVIEVSSGEPWTRWSETDTAIVQMPNFHVAGTSWALQWLARGATCVIQTQVNPREILEAIEAHGVTQLFAVPTVLQMMLDDETCVSRDFSRLKLVHYGASPISPSLLRRLSIFGSDLVQYYGMTETNGVVSFLSPDLHRSGDPDMLLSVGKPYPALDIRIMDPLGVELPRGATGEICIRTPAMMKGYWNRPAETEQSRHGDYHRSGDAGYMTKHGFLYIVDRVKDMIISGGENIYPAEVERVICEHPAVREVAVIGVPDPKWGQAVKAVVVAKESVGADDLAAFLGGKLARYKMPKTYEFVAELPRNAAGKVLKRELRQRYAAR
jgi:acyl-CoA synthetase (AMP-forming)/AMP-acid ligase II